MQVGLENWNLFNSQFLCGLFVSEECSQRLVGVFFSTVNILFYTLGTNLLGWGDLGTWADFGGISNFGGLCTLEMGVA